RRTFDAGEPRETTVCEADLDGFLQPVGVGRRRRLGFENRPEFFGPHARAAGQMKPVGRVAFAERVRQGLTETKLALRDARSATSTLGPRAQRRLDHVRQFFVSPRL